MLLLAIKKNYYDITLALNSVLYKFQINPFLNNQQYILSLTTKLKTIPDSNKMVDKNC